MTEENRKDLPNKEEIKNIEEKKEIETKEEIKETKKEKEEIQSKEKKKEKERKTYNKKELYLYLSFLIGSILAIVAGIYLYFNWIENTHSVHPSNNGTITPNNTSNINNSNTQIVPTTNVSEVTLIVIYNNSYNLTKHQVTNIIDVFKKFGINISKVEYEDIREFQKKYNIPYYQLRVNPALALKANENILKTLINKSLIKINNNIYLIKPEALIFYLKAIAKANYIITSKVDVILIEGKYVLSSERLKEGIKLILKYLYAVNLENIKILNYSSYLNSNYSNKKFEFFPVIIVVSSFPINDLNNYSISTNNNIYEYTLPPNIYSIFLQYGYLDYIETTKEPNIEDFPRLGSNNANIIFIEYADVHCPYCALFDNRTVEKLINEFVKNGTVEYVFKDFIIHKDAEDLHKLLRCFYEKVKNKSKYFEVLHWIYSTFWNRIINKKYKPVSYNELKLKLKEYYNILDLERCIEENGSKYSKIFKEVSIEAQNYGITGTPGIIIWKKDEHRGIITLGARNYNFIKYIIEHLMKGEPL